MPEPPQFFNSHRKVVTTKNRLPHWEQDGCTFFLTFRLADSLPKRLLNAWTEERRIWKELNPEPWSDVQEAEYHERFSGMKERWLDAMYGSCALREPTVRRLLVDRLREPEGTIWSFIIMPNHVHVLFSLIGSQLLSMRLQEWKGGSAYQINGALGRSGKLWAKDYFDRLIRNEKHFWNCARYIRKNPRKARLRSEEFSLFESDYVAHAMG